MVLKNRCKGVRKLDGSPHSVWCCYRYSRTDSKNVCSYWRFLRKRVFRGLSSIFGTVRKDGSGWIGPVILIEWKYSAIQIKLRAKQKYKVLSATLSPLQRSGKIKYHFILGCQIHPFTDLAITFFTHKHNFSKKFCYYAERKVCLFISEKIFCYCWARSCNVLVCLRWVVSSLSVVRSLANYN